MKNEQLYRSIPKMDHLLEDFKIKEAVKIYGKTPVVGQLRVILSELREEIACGIRKEQLEVQIGNIEQLLKSRLKKQYSADLKRVINATGVVLHTNLGRAPLPKDALCHMTEILSSYSNLEYSLELGKRGTRESHFEELICEITGAEAALAVNNNAAAVMLMISSVAGGREVLVSRGEQVEIGGRFRIPDIVAQSGAVCVEIGATNRTRISDYESHITEDTAAFLKVHTSNFRMIGFVEEVSRAELVELGEKTQIPVIEDLGSGVLIDLSKYGLVKEPTVAESIRAGVDLVSFSGDKLLGGPQAGVIVGKKKWVDLCRNHPLMRALRVDKFTIGMLEEVFALYRDEKKAVEQLPVLAMLTVSEEELRRKAATLAASLEILKEKYRIQVQECDAVAGGGSLPGEVLKSWCVAISPNKNQKKEYNLKELEQRLRSQAVPIISRIVQDQIIFDVRTIFEDELEETAGYIIEGLK